MESRIIKILINIPFVLVLTCLILIPNHSTAQLLNWANGFGGSALQQATSIAVDASGNIFIAGNYTSAGIDFDGDVVDDVTNTSPGTNDIFLAKFDKDGNFIAALNIGGSGEDYVNDMAIDNSNYPVIVGSYDGTVGMDTNEDSFIDFSGSTTSDGYVLYFYSLNSTLTSYVNFGHTFNSSSGGFTIPRGVTVNSKDSILVTGKFKGTTDFFPGFGLNKTSYNNSSDIFLTRLNTTGSTPMYNSWVNTYGGDNNDQSFGIACDQNDNIVLTGYFEGSADLNNDATPETTSHGGYDMFVIKNTPDGAFLWSKYIGGALQDIGEDVAIDGSDNIYVSGYFTTSADVDEITGDDIYSNGTEDIVLAKYTASGSLVWGNNFGTAGDDEWPFLALSSDGRINVTGNTSDEIFIARVDSGGGYLLRDRVIPGTINKGLAIATDPTSDDIIITGYFSSTGVDFNNDGTNDITRQGTADIFLAKYYGSLNGSYFIDPAGEIPDFNTAVELLTADGITNNVEFQVKSGTYNEQVYFPYYLGIDPARTVTFRSESGNPDDVILTWNNDGIDNYTLSLDGPDNVVFRDMTIEGQNATYGRIIEINGVDNDQLLNNKILGQSKSATTLDDFLVYCQGSYNVVINNNTFKDGDAGLQIDAFDNTTVTISGNTFNGQASQAVQFTDNTVVNLNFTDNTIISQSTGMSWGVYENNCDGNIQIRKNKIYITNGDALYVEGPVPGTTTTDQIINNFMKTANGYGINLTSHYNHQLINNSVMVGNIDGSGSGNAALYMDDGSDITDLHNNIFANYTGGYAVDLGSISNLGADNNDYFTSGSVLNRAFGTEYAGLADWQGFIGGTVDSDGSSISVDPEYVSDINLHTYNTELRIGIPYPALVPNDIDGDVRNSTNPFIGADESSLYVDQVAWYPLDNDLNDYSGNGYDLTSSGTLSATTDNNGNASSASLFSGSEYASYSMPAPFTLAKFSISFWFAALASDMKQTLIARGANDPGGPAINYQVWIGADNYLYAGYEYDDKTLINVKSSDPLKTGKWYQAVVILDNTNSMLDLYLNGKSDASVSVTNPPGANSVDNLIIGTNLDATANPENFFNGALDEIHIYNKVLTSLDLNAAYYQNLSPMHGIYTIGTASPVNIGDYPSFNDAIIDMNERNIDGDITFNVEPGNYNEQITIPYINNSDLYFITFQSENSDSSGVNINWDQGDINNNYVVQLYNAKNITFKSLTFENTSSIGGNVFLIQPGTNNIKFYSNRVWGSGNGNDVAINALVYKPDSTAGNDMEFEFSDNEFKSGSYGILFNECDSLTLDHNIFSNQDIAAVSTSKVPKPVVTQNVISSNTEGFSKGISLRQGLYDDGTTYGMPTVYRNKIDVTGNMNGFGIYLGNFPADTSVSRGLIANNFIHLDGFSDGFAGIGLNSSGGTDIYYNSVNLTDTFTVSSALYLNSSHDVKILNNIFANYAQGYAYYSASGNADIISNYNDFDFNGERFGFFGGADVGTLTDWQNQSGFDAKSQVLAPSFVSKSDLHTTEIGLVNGIPISGITEDIDGDFRNNVQTTMGADNVNAFKSDSLVLVAFYDSLDGPNWKDNSNWLTGKLATWFGIVMGDGRVIQINMDDNNLTGEIPPSIGDLTELEVLNITHDSITAELPGEIWTLKNLSTLKIRDSYLKGTIPQEIGNLANLGSLDLAFNELTGPLPESIGNLNNLYSMILDFNNLDGTIPDTIANLGNLQYIYLGNNNFTGSITDRMNNLDSLKLLDLFENNLEGIPDLSSLEKMIEYRVEFNKLDFGDLEPNINVTGFEYFPQDSVGVEKYDTLDAGATLTLKVNVGGNNNLYQWYFDSTAVTGANSAIFTIDRLFPENFGDYYCEITNSVITDLTLTSRIFHVINSGNGDVEKPMIGSPDFPDSHVKDSGSETISVEVTDNDKVDLVYLYHKGILSGPSQWTREDLTGNVSQSTYSQPVPESDFDEAGMMFYITAFDVTGNKDSVGVFYIYINIGNTGNIPGLKTGNTIASYQIISIPYQLNPNTVTDVFADDFDNKIDHTVWRIVGYSGSDYSDLGASSAISRGTGYWFIKTKDTDISLPDATFPDNNQENPFTMQIRQNWNLIGNPYPFSISWSAVQDANPDISLGELNTWTGNSYAHPQNLDIFEGAFIHADTAGTIIIPFERSGARIAREGNSTFDTSIDSRDWLMNLNLDAESMYNHLGGIGMHENASMETDQYDTYTLPPFVQYLNLNHKAKDSDGNPVTRSIVSPGESYSWNFSVNTSLTDEEITLSWNNDPFKLARSSLWLHELQNGKTINMKTESSYTFRSPGQTKFRINYSRDPVNENQPMLNLPYPNPFNRTLVIGLYVKDEFEKVRADLSVLSLTGQPVKNLLNRNLLQGYHTVIWDGQNSKGNNVPAGMYIIRLSIVSASGQKGNFYRKIIKK